MKKSVLDLEFLQHSDLSPGTQIRGNVIAIEDYGILLKLSEKMIGLIPLIHLADITIRKPGAKFKLDQKVKCKVLYVDSKEKKITLTAKKTLLNSKFDIISSYNTPPGTISHGFIKAIKSNGVIVGFYNKVNAFAPKNEITDDDSNPEDLFKIGQPVQCRVISSSFMSKKMLVSFKITENTEAYENLQLGSIQSGKIIQYQNEYIIFQLDCGVRARLRKFHFSDIPSFYDPWMEYFKLQNNKKISNLLVLSKPSHRPIELTQKSSLINENKNEKLPSLISDFSVGNIVFGFIKRISNSAIHIGFMGDVLGLVPKSHVADEFVENPSDYFIPGQSVRAYVIEIKENTIILSLKQSLCGTNGIEWIKQYFKEEKQINEKLYNQSNKTKTKQQQQQLKVGEIIKGKIQEKTDLGFLIEINSSTKGLLLKEHISNDQFAKNNIGDQLKLKILDISQTSNDQKIIDLSCLDHLLKQQINEKENQKIISSLKEDKEYQVKIELIKTKYLVVSYKGIIGFVGINDYNSSKKFNPFDHYTIGKKISVILNDKNSNDFSLYSRSILFSIPIKNKILNENSNQEILSLSEIQPGMIVSGKIVKIVSHTMKVSIGYHVLGRINVTEVLDHESKELPFSTFNEGEIITAKVLSVKEIPSNKHLPISHQNPVARRILELTIRPSKVNLPPPELGTPIITWNNANQFLGKTIHAVIYEIRQKSRSLGLHISSEVQGSVPVNFLPEIKGSYTCDLANHFSIGQCIPCKVVYVDSKHKVFCVSLRNDNDTDDNGDYFKRFNNPGELIMGRVIKKIIGKGLLMEISPGCNGFVDLTEIIDEFKPRPEKITKPNRFHRCVVLSKLKSDKLIPLSMRKSRFRKDVPAPVNPPYTSIDELKEGQIVSGYSKSISIGNGIVVSLSRDVDVYIPHNELGEKVNEKIEIKFIHGRLVTVKIESINKNSDDNHAIIGTLKKSKILSDSNDSDSPKISIQNISKGQKLKGYVRNVKDFGILIEIKHSNRLIGLCHKSEISDKKNLKWRNIFTKGDYVKVVVLEVDPEKNRLLLGMKPSYFTEDDVEFDSDDDEDDENDISESNSLLVDDDDDDENSNAMDMDDSDDEAESILNMARNQMTTENSSSEDDDEANIQMKDAESSSDDDDDSSDDDNEAKNTLGSTSFEWNDFSIKPTTNKKSQQDDSDDDDDDSEDSEEDSDDQEVSKRSKKYAKQREEEKISEKEKELLSDNNSPETISDYERLILSAPNDSFLWIKYMAFLLSMTEIEKARSVAERALKRIDLRKEEEKLNVWIAYMNLELIYGSKDSLEKLIQRALSYNEPKIVYQRLIDIYETAGKLKDAENIFSKILKKFKHSQAIWLKYCTFKMTHGDKDEAREAFQKATKLLPQRKSN